MGQVRVVMCQNGAFSANIIRINAPLDVEACPISGLLVVHLP